MSATVFCHEIGHHAIGFRTYRPRCLEGTTPGRGPAHDGAFGERHAKRARPNARLLHYAVLKARGAGSNGFQPNSSRSVTLDQDSHTRFGDWQANCVGHGYDARRWQCVHEPLSEVSHAVSSASSNAQQLAITAAKAEGRNQRIVSAETFGQTRGAIASNTLQNQADSPTYSLEQAKKSGRSRRITARRRRKWRHPEPQVAESVQFTQSDIDNLMKIFGFTSDDSEFIADYDLDGNRTIDLQDLNQMLAQIGEPQPAGAGDPETFTQTDIDLLMEAFGAQAGDENYSDSTWTVTGHRPPGPEHHAGEPGTGGGPGTSRRHTSISDGGVRGADRR